MSRSNKDRSACYRYAAIALGAVFLVGTAFFLLSLWEKGNGQFPVIDATETVVEYGGRKYERNKNVETFLVLGLDKTDTDVPESYNNDKQADLIILLVFDHGAGTCTAVSVNRDTVTDVNILGVAGNRIDTVKKQIALAHTYGNGREVSCRNTADAVSSLLLGIKIDHYLSATYNAVPICNDLVGGVTLEVLDDLTSADPALKKGASVTLTGEQALTYVRARAGLDDSTNIARMKRQRQYLSALREKAVDKMRENGDFAVQSAPKVAEYIVSDRSLEQLAELFKTFADYEFLGIRELEGESKAGDKFMEFHPDAEALNAAVIELFYKPID